MKETFARLRRTEIRHTAYVAGAFAMREAIAGWASRALGRACAAGIRRIEIPEDKQFPAPEDLMSELLHREVMLKRAHGALADAGCVVPIELDRTIEHAINALAERALTAEERLEQMTRERDALRSSLERKIRHCDEILEERDALADLRVEDEP